MNKAVLNLLRKSLYNGDIELKDVKDMIPSIEDVAILSWDEYAEIFPEENVKFPCSEHVNAAYKLEKLMSYFNVVTGYSPDWLDEYDLKACIHPSKTSLYIDIYRTIHNFLLAFPDNNSANAFIRKNKDIIYDYYRMQ